MFVLAGWTMMGKALDVMIRTRDGCLHLYLAIHSYRRLDSCSMPFVYGVKSGPDQARSMRIC